MFPAGLVAALTACAPLPPEPVAAPPACPQAPGPIAGPTTAQELFCAGLWPESRGVAPAGPECRALGGDSVEAVTLPQQTYLCCMVPGDAAASQCLPAKPIPLTPDN